MERLLFQTIKEERFTKRKQLILYSLMELILTEKEKSKMRPVFQTKTSSKRTLLRRISMKMSNLREKRKKSRRKRKKKFRMETELRKEK